MIDFPRLLGEPINFFSWNQKKWMGILFLVFGCFGMFWDVLGCFGFFLGDV
jgi:hypothetical protein